MHRVNAQSAGVTKRNKQEHTHFTLSLSPHLGRRFECISVLLRQDVGAHKEALEMAGHSGDGDNAGAFDAHRALVGPRVAGGAREMAACRQDGDLGIQDRKAHLAVDGDTTARERGHLRSALASGMRLDAAAVGSSKR